MLLPYNLLIHQDSDVCSTILVPPLQNFDFSSRRVQGAIESPDVVATHQRHRLEQLGGIKTHAYGSTFANSRCLTECSVRCLVEQRSGLKKFSVQPYCTLSASLVARGCSVRAPISGSYCVTKEEHWARLSESELQKIVLAFNWRSIDISQVPMSTIKLLCSVFAWTLEQYRVLCSALICCVIIYAYTAVVLTGVQYRGLVFAAYFARQSFSIQLFRIGFCTQKGGD